jgi:DNA end-binding protein Ku
MAARFSWKSFLRLSLVTVPVKGYNAVQTGGGEIHLNQLHEPCHSRIRYKKVCPIHGEVANNEIVSGYEFAKDQYVIVDKSDLEKLRPEAEKAINLDTFVAADAIDPMYLDGRVYYLVPDGPVGRKPYAVLYQAMLETERYAVGQGTFGGKQELVLIRPSDGLLTLSMLHYAAEMRTPADFDEDLELPAVAKQELKLAQTLIDASTAKKFDLGKYENNYTESLKALIDAKVEGKELVAPPQAEEPAVINIMDALRESVARAKGGESAQEGSSSRIAKPAKKAAPPRPKSAARKRKTS